MSTELVKDTGRAVESRREALGRLLWLACLLALLVNAILVVKSTWVVNYAPTDWGLVNRFPINFWVGLILVTLLLFLGRHSTGRTAVGVGAVLLYLYAIPTFITEYGTEFLTASRFTTATGLVIAQEGSLIFNVGDHLALYYYWPAYQLQVAATSLVTGWNSLGICSWFPLVILSVWTLLVFLILRVSLDTHSSLWGCILFLATYIVCQNALGPQGIAYILYLAFFLLLMKLSYGKIEDTPGAHFLLILRTNAHECARSYPKSPTKTQ